MGVSGARQNGRGSQLFDMDAFEKVKAAATKGREGEVAPAGPDAASGPDEAVPYDDAMFEDHVSGDSAFDDDAAAGAAAAAEVAEASGAAIEFEAAGDDLPNPRRRGDAAAAAALLSFLPASPNTQRGSSCHRIVKHRRFPRTR